MALHSLQARAAVAAALGVLGAIGVLACDSDPTTPEPERTLRAIRDATRAYQSVDAAVAAGYAPAGPCVAHPSMGAMGIHYSRATLADGTVDPTQPEVLLYAPSPGGSLQLVGVEFLVPAAAWDASNSAPPMLSGQPFDDHRAPEARHGLPFPHYDLHAWVWRDNPNGVFAPFNPAVSC
ncbi:MAG TPA: hypothetical protein VF746_21060 [Longimicrobium sp.]|jgi:hypothetical protein